MPALKTDTTVQPTLDMPLNQKQTAALRIKFSLYAKTVADIKALEATKDELKAKIALVREEAGVTSLTLDGYKTTVVAPVRSTLNIKKLFAMGVTEAMIKEATDVVPGTAYEKISLPSTKGDE